MAAEVLIVDDSRSLAALLSRKIERNLGITCRIIGRYEDARALLEENADSLLAAVMGLQLPDATGGQVVDLVTSFGVPSIVLTGSLDDAVRERMITKPIVDYVIKQNPSEMDYVVRVLRHLHRAAHATVLVVDDSTSSRRHLARILSNHRFDVLEARDGEEALETLAAHPEITLVITDYRMPRLDGRGLVAGIRRQYRRDELPVIGLSGQEEDGISARLLKAGANDFLTKPFSIEEFTLRLMQNMEMRELIRDITETSNRDYLTGLYNRRYLHDRGEKLHGQAHTQGTPLTAAIMDIDYFKRINDRYGHYAGDACLQEVARTLRETVNGEDVVARYGGEEFALLLTATASEATRMLETVRHTFETYPVEVDGVRINLTVSIGLTNELKHSVSAMLDEADRRLYAAKAGGRNRLVTTG